MTSVDPNRRYADPDPGDPHLMEFRARHALRRALAQLIGEGLIAPWEGNQYPIQPTRISVTYHPCAAERQLRLRLAVKIPAARRWL
jgi:hypothetical protein